VYSSFTGLRATERDLAKLKCIKCDYQAYYAQQLQQHLRDTHADDLSDLVRCKCCTFLCFDEDTLFTHMKVCAAQDNLVVFNSVLNVLNRVFVCILLSRLVVSGFIYL